MTIDTVLATQKEKGCGGYYDGQAPIVGCVEKSTSIRQLGKNVHVIGDSKTP
jgi:hypothetical protein